MNKKTMKTIFCIVAIYFSALWIFRDPVLLFSWKIVSFHDLALLKIALVSFLAFLGYHSWLYSKKPKLEASDEEIEGIPKEELIDFLWKQKSFSAKEAVSHFGITTQTHSKVSGILQNAKVIIKTKPNNKLMLNEEYSREDLADCFYSGTVAAPFKIKR